ncbi:uncharacterized protein BXZ73DRAFT_78211 [Epithele typhae]|uniref:uncharacterized protein n=1 Tax=Epithele typhae TaxID=378194 RepID=UPI0020080291|nr:uncharacterized protein BXZ73DRAFT_78211 [Epithele typhae]KAH9929062.1 hypothetical protein BXZ73DRAFT_78211 [Epithele typhae]
MYTTPGPHTPKRSSLVWGDSVPALLMGAKSGSCRCCPLCLAFAAARGVDMCPVPYANNVDMHGRLMWQHVRSRRSDHALGRMIGRLDAEHPSFSRSGTQGSPPGRGGMGLTQDATNGGNGPERDGGHGGPGERRVVARGGENLGVYGGPPPGPWVSGARAAGGTAADAIMRLVHLLRRPPPSWVAVLSGSRQLLLHKSTRFDAFISASRREGGVAHPLQITGHAPSCGIFSRPLIEREVVRRSHRPTRVTENSARNRPAGDHLELVLQGRKLGRSTGVARANCTFTTAGRLCTRPSGNIQIIVTSALRTRFIDHPPSVA